MKLGNLPKAKEYFEWARGSQAEARFSRVGSLNKQIEELIDSNDVTVAILTCVGKQGRGGCSYAAVFPSARFPTVE